MPVLAAADDDPVAAGVAHHGGVAARRLPVQVVPMGRGDLRQVHAGLEVLELVRS